MEGPAFALRSFQTYSCIGVIPIKELIHPLLPGFFINLVVFSSCIVHGPDQDVLDVLPLMISAEKFTHIAYAQAIVLESQLDLCCATSSFEMTVPLGIKPGGSSLQRNLFYNRKNKSVSLNQVEFPAIFSHADPPNRGFLSHQCHPDRGGRK